MAFLGVATSPVPPAMAAQLGLPEGFGLVVDQVAPDSPAGKAGVQRFDVLRRFNDQLLTDPGQLAALVHAQGRGAEVSLTLLRKGEEIRVGVELSERATPERRPLSSRDGAVQERMERAKAELGDNARRMQEKAREFAQRLREYQDRLQKWRANPEGELPKMPELHPSDRGAESPREARPDGGARGDRRPDGEGGERRIESRSSVSVGSANAKVVMKDESGEIEVTERDGRRHLIAKNAKGETVFDGPIDTREQMRALPEDLRRKVESVRVQTNVESSPAPARRPAESEREGR